jgi:SanA protein
MRKIRWKKVVLYSFLLSVFIVCWSNFSVYYESKDFISKDVSELPPVKTGLLLGTSRNLRGGSENAYFFHRIDACVKLYEAGKIKNILISGDNGRKDYNEPEDMKQELMARGIPEAHIFLDYAGFDTYDSVLRAWKIFGQKSFIVISQHFHNQRAVYIARRFGLNAYGYDATDVQKMYGIKTKFREFFACVKAYFEVKLNVEPTFLGEQIPIQ